MVSKMLHAHQIAQKYLVRAIKSHSEKLSASRKRSCTQVLDQLQKYPNLGTERKPDEC